MSPIFSGFDMGFGNPNTVPLFNHIGPLAAHLSANIAAFRNPSFYSYALDGTTSDNILDGGSDMYDRGNITTPALISGITFQSSSTTLASYTDRIFYGNTSETILDTNFKYAALGYTTSPDKRPLTVIGTRSSVGQPIGWQKGGNLGADGAGSVTTARIYDRVNVDGFTVVAFYRQISGAGDPTVGDLYILLGHPRWDSVFGTITTTSNASTDVNGGSLLTSGADVKNILAISTLLSRSGGTSIPSTDYLTVTNSFITQIKEYFRF